MKKLILALAVVPFMMSGAAIAAKKAESRVEVVQRVTADVSKDGKVSNVHIKLVKAELLQDGGHKPGDVQKAKRVGTMSIFGDIAGFGLGIAADLAGNM